jgi:hypothetical protein
MTMHAAEDRGQRSENVARIRNRRGLSLVEALISLAIAATLLTAVAAACSAASDAIKMNDQFFRASQAARVSVNQIISQVRTCQSGVVSSTSLELTAANGQRCTYALDTDSRKLTLTLEDLVPPVTHTMASNVGTLQFLTDGKTIAMTITVEVGHNQVTLNGSAIPRRTVTYH